MATSNSNTLFESVKEFGTAAVAELKEALKEDEGNENSREDERTERREKL